jgi:hypothetical protein
MTKSVGVILLGIWLILFGAFTLIHVEASGLILAIWAIITGIFILVGK